jgi:hypothetical protein
MYRAAFPDLRMDAEDVLASGDKTVARVKATGTQQGELMGIPPAGKHVDVQLIDITRFDDAGLVTEHWGVTDMMSMMQQLGVVPAGPLHRVAKRARLTRRASFTRNLAEAHDQVPRGRGARSFDGGDLGWVKAF